MSITLDGIPVIPSVHKIVVKLKPTEKILSSGIIIPDTVNKETDYVGDVVAISRTEEDVKVGDVVALRKHSGVTAQVDNTDGIYKTFQKTDVLYVC